MKKKLRIAILFGGQSAEHEISLLSARNIYQALNKKKYQIIAVGIDKRGRWFVDESARLLRDPQLTKVEFAGMNKAAAIVPGETPTSIIEPLSGKHSGAVDVVIPVLHGPFGEDGTIQGLLKLANLPFVGAGVLGSAVGMDKDVMKRLLRDAGIAVAKFVVFERAERSAVSFTRVKKALGLPLFVKPANLGSSVGISKVARRNQFASALREAFRYDNKIIVEEAIRGRELECSVLGNEYPIASLPGEVVVAQEFYSYDAKYLDEQGARLEIPARLPKKIVREIQHTAVRAYRALCCEGMARVDFFLRSNGEVLVNEINTIPGFTRISMYPKMWQASGLSYARLIDRLIALALERSRNEKRLKSSI